VGRTSRGAALYKANLQGASLDGAQLQGASFDEKGLQGAPVPVPAPPVRGSRNDRAAELQNASLVGVFVWRTVPPGWGFLEGSLILGQVSKAKYQAEYFPSDCENLNCDWTKDYYEALEAKIDAVPPGPLRDQALRRLEPLGDDRHLLGDEIASEAWLTLEKASTATRESYPARLAQTLSETGCDERGAPYVIRGLLAQLDERFGQGVQPDKAAVAKAFLEPSCDGARGLSDDEKARLHQLAGPPAKERGAEWSQMR
jgi:hypothetical protein